MNQAEAYYAQAESDFRVFLQLEAQPRDLVPECHPLHYLQMAAEKLTKAILAAEGRDPTHSHLGLTAVLQSLRRQEVGRALGLPDFKSYQRMLDSQKKLMREVEDLHSTRGGPENVEYPWETREATSAVGWSAPAYHTFGTLSKIDRSNRKLVKLLHLLLSRLPVLYPQVRQ